MGPACSIMRMLAARDRQRLCERLEMGPCIHTAGEVCVACMIRCLEAHARLGGPPTSLAKAGSPLSVIGLCSGIRDPDSRGLDPRAGLHRHTAHISPGGPRHASVPTAHPWLQSYEGGLFSSRQTQMGPCCRAGVLLGCGAGAPLCEARPSHDRVLQRHRALPVHPLPLLLALGHTSRTATGCPSLDRPRRVHACSGPGP